ncbi:MAG TPA: TIGR02646 family protein [Agitococcus sp.]|nr:TIGR02646 family protein [Agitococcus sp.]HNC02782.1 TIGR02646 family protein [Agitococcus sp.]
MRSITKIGNGGYQLNRSHQTPPTTSDQATSRWSSFGYKEEVTQSLLAEQYGLCAYSEVRPDQLGLGVHIEHIEPKSANPARTFDYSNLVLSALSSDDLKTIDKTAVFGGHAKLSQYDALLFISCLQADCGRYFVYLSNGNVEPAYTLEPEQKSKAQYTIDLLNLNSPYLVNQRKNWIDELDELIDEHIQKNMSLDHLAAIDLLPFNNKLSPFFTATRQRFGQIANQLLAANASELS